ncbi:unnamed protein product [Gemmata massiliana]|uniref:Uncharacterized protein n=1 Tax=Gemmata massiliana TaxID=1210884 RepID=A0A6P2D5J9_9BACT|nr:unnamed protein product [Gemmata massiliana]
MAVLVLFLARVAGILPGVGLVMMADSVSKEPNGFPLYFVTACGGLALSQVGWLRVGPERNALSISSIGVSVACSLVATGAVALVVIAYLFVTGH